MLLNSSRILSAKQDWESASIEYTLVSSRSNGRKIEEPFRRFGDSIAWLEWSSYCTIKKIETLKPKTGAATLLLNLLKNISLKYSIHIFGNPIPYAPSHPSIILESMSQKRLLDHKRPVISPTASAGYFCEAYKV
jgi:hypothetical protein